MGTMGGAPELETLWRESSARLRSWFEQHTGSGADAEDLLQETFLRVHERLDTLLDAASIRGWLGRIARNVLVDHMRSRLPRPRTEASPIHADEESIPAPEDEAILDGVVAGWLEGFLRELDPADAEALHLVDLEGKTQRELAARAGWSGSSSSRTRR